MRNVEDSELGDALWMKQGGAPGDGSSPIVSREKDFFSAELIDDGDNVGNEFWQSVGGYAGGFATEAIAALVGDDDAKARGSQRLDLAPPSIPEFWETVEKNDDRAVMRTCSNRVQAYCAILE